MHQQPEGAAWVRIWRARRLNFGRSLAPIQLRMNLAVAMSETSQPVSEHISNSQIPWRILRVKTGREFEVSNLIAEMGFETYCPRVISTSKVRFGPETVRQDAVRAMFPAYTCARIKPDARLDRLARRGYLLKVFFQSPLSEAVIEFIRVTELEAATMTARKVKIQPGDFGTIMQGMLKGEPIEVLQIRKSKLIVKLTKFGSRSAPIQIAADDVAVTA